MKKTNLVGLVAIMLFTLGSFGASYVQASNCSDPVTIPNEKNRLLNLAGCKPAPGTCVIVRCPIVIK